jgi:hypothetical protein
LEVRPLDATERETLDYIAYVFLSLMRLFPRCPSEGQRAYVIRLALLWEHGQPENFNTRNPSALELSNSDVPSSGRSE